LRDRDSQRRGGALALKIDTYGPLLLALYLLATTRWGSYVIPGPPYIADFVLMGLLANRALVVAAGRSRGSREVGFAVAAGALLAWAGMRFVFGDGASSFDAQAARDAAPYLYAVLAFLVVPLNATQAEVARRLINWALIFHLAWVTVRVVVGHSNFAPALPWSPNESLRVFALRPDIDTVVCGLLAGLALHRALSGRSVGMNFLLCAWALAVALAGLDARAGILAVLVQLLVVAALAPVRKRETRALRERAGGAWRAADRRLAVALVIVALPVLIAAAPNAPVIKSLPLGLKPHESHAFTGTNADATARARLRSWSRLVDWIEEDAGRMAVGVGFGPHFYLDSGALRLLSTKQREEIRSPHNYWLNTWARLGIAGLGLVVAILVIGLRLVALVVRKAPELRDVDLVAILVFVAMPVAATFGVVMESPFGALPFFWALGHLSARACQIGAARSLAEAIGRRPAKPALP